MDNFFDIFTIIEVQGKAEISKYGKNCKQGWAKHYVFRGIPFSIFRFPRKISGTFRLPIPDCKHYL